MDVDEADGDDEEVPTTLMLLVGEDALEGMSNRLCRSERHPQMLHPEAKSRYARIYSMHVYCLSSSPLNVRFL